MHTERVSAVWQIREREREVARKIAPILDLHPVAAEILLQRGIKEKAAMQRFLYPDLSHLHDPWLLPDMPAAVARIRLAIEKQQHVAIYGDYDVDGLTATALLMRYLREIGVAVCHYIPARLDDGYGLHREAIAELAAHGVELLITVDCGINAQEEVSFASSLGMDVIVTDHHTPDLECIPQAIAVINPKLDSDYPFQELAGVGVALKLVQALGGLAAAAKYLDLAALGTIADIVPLLDENRVMVRFGLESLRASQRPGIRALLAAAGIEPTALKSGQVAFTLAPRLNAAGRLNEADTALQLLLTEDDTEAVVLAEKLGDFNARRQAIEQSIFAEADAMASQLAPEASWCIVLAKEGWHPGVIGIVASRLVERYHRPTILLTVEAEQAHGSGRSIPGYDLVASLREHAALLTSYGGHRAAAGLSLPVAAIPELRDALNLHVQASLETAELQPLVYLDAELDPSEVTLDLVHSLERLGPFGAGHPEPVFCSKRWRVGGARSIGREGQHLKLDMQGGGLPWEVLAWRRGEELDEIRQTDWLDVAYTPQANVWQGYERLVLHLRSWRPPDLADSVAVYDARFIPNRDDYLQSLLAEEQTVLLIFWPAFCLETKPRLQERLGLAQVFWQPGPVYLRLLNGRWQSVPADTLAPNSDLVWLDSPQGEPGLARLASDLKDTLYHHRIHLLYNVNDIERAFNFLAQNGPNRSAMATLYRGLKAARDQSRWYWDELCQVMRAEGFLGLPDQISFHLQVLQELTLAECACSSEGVRVNWLPEPPERQDLGKSLTFSRAQAKLDAFADATDWLRGPDAGGIIARKLRSLLSDQVSG